ncbi:MAG: hypothetical protein R3C68_05765 [Myxococcota bacterium]
MKAIASVFFLAATSACNVGLNIGNPESLPIACTDDSECPGQLICNTTRQTCVSPDVRDFEAPILIGSALLEPATLAVGGAETATLALTFNENLSSPPQVTFSRRGTPVSFATTQSAGESLYELTYTVGDDDVEGVFPIELRAEDANKNELHTVLDVALTFDFTPPSVLPNSLVARPASGSDNVVGNIQGIPEALTLDGTMTVEFIVSEDLGDLPAVSLLGPAALDAATVEVLGRRVTATFDMGSVTTLEGIYTDVRIVISDVAGNSQDKDFALGVDIQGPTQLVFDTTAPDPADTTTPRSIVLSRAPWGTRDSSNAPFNKVSGAADAVEGRAYVAAYAAPNDDPDDALNFIRAQEDGSFGPILLGAADRSEVFLRVIDPAGNVSPLTRIRDTDWYAVTTPVSAPGSPPNTHAFYEQPRATGLPNERQDTDLSGSSALASADDVTVSTVGAGQWLSRRHEFEPPWRYRAHVFHDPSTNDLYLVGGTVQGSNVAKCDGADGLCRDLYRRDSLFWEPVNNIAGSGEDLPSFVDDFSIAYDVANQKVVGYDAERQRLYEWSNGVWRRHTTADPNDLGPRRFTGARMIYDAVRAQLLLFGGNGFPADCDGNSYCAQTWAWRNGWRQVITATTPPGRVDPVMVYDTIRNVVLMTGGSAFVGAGQPCGDGSTSWSNGRCYFNDLWEFNGADWSKRCDGIPATDVCSRVPYRTDLAGGAFDPKTGSLLTFGGRSIPGPTGPACEDGSAKDAASQCVYSASWLWDGSDWTRFDPDTSGGTDTDPLARWGAAVGYDIKQGKLILFGGIRGGGFAPAGGRQSTYAWQGDGWERQRNPLFNNEPGRPRKNFAFSRSRNGAFLFGGDDFDDETCGGVSGIVCGDAYYWGSGLGDLAWSPADCNIGASCPVFSTGVRAAYDPAIGETVIVGGHDP